MSPRHLRYISPISPQVSTVDLEHVLYGSRNADLLDFLHGDLPKQVMEGDVGRCREM